MYLNFLPAYMRGKKKKQNKTKETKKTNSYKIALSPDLSVIAITQTLYINFMNQSRGTHSPDVRCNCFGGRLPETMSFVHKNRPCHGLRRHLDE